MSEITYDLYPSVICRFSVGHHKIQVPRLVERPPAHDGALIAREARIGVAAQAARDLAAGTRAAGDAVARLFRLEEGDSALTQNRASHPTERLSTQF